MAATGCQAMAVGSLAWDVGDWGLVRAQRKIRNVAGIGKISVSIYGRRLFLFREDVILAFGTNGIIVFSDARTPNPLYYFRHLRILLVSFTKSIICLNTIQNYRRK